MKNFDDSPSVDDKSAEQINPLGEDKFTVKNGEFTTTRMTEAEARQAVFDAKKEIRERRAAREK